MDDPGLAATFFSSQQVQAYALAALMLVVLGVIYRWERDLRYSAPEPEILQYRRASFYTKLSLVAFVALVTIVVVAGQVVGVLEMVATVIFWMSMAAMVSTLLLLILRFVILVGLSFLEFDFFGKKNHDDAPDDIDERSLPLVTLVVPAYNEDKVIRGSIDSLLKLDYPNYEIVVVDDGSKDSTYLEALRAAEMEPERVRVLTQANMGKSEALNHGIHAARGDFVLCMDADSRLSPQSIRVAVRHMLTDPGLGAVAGAVKAANRHNTITKLQELEYLQGLNIVRRAFSWAHAVNIIPGPLGLFRKSAIYSVGGYESDTFAEDCDITIRLLMKGWRIKYEPEAQAWTEVPETLLDLYQQRYRWTRGIIQAVVKHRGILTSPLEEPVNSFILWYMLFETLMWPVLNLIANLLMLHIAFAYGMSQFLLTWWLLLTTLDVVISFLSISMEDEDQTLLPYSILYRLVFTLVIDVCKVIATIEQFLGLEMGWGKLTRVGRI